VRQHSCAVEVQLILDSNILTQHTLVLQPAPAAKPAVPADDGLVNLQETGASGQHARCTTMGWLCT
jgi:hypothetical protein